MLTDTSVFRLWRRNVWLAGAVAINVLIPVSVALAVLVAAFNGRPAVLPAGAVLCALAAVTVVRALTARVTVRDGTVTVRNPLRSYSLPASEIDRVSMKRLTANEAAVRLHRCHGGDIIALAVPVGRHSRIPELLEALEAEGAPATIRSGFGTDPRSVRANY